LPQGRGQHSLLADLELRQNQESRCGWTLAAILTDDEGSMPTPSPELADLAASPRVQMRRDGPPRGDGRCVVYWMQRAQRIEGNPALEVAIAAANLLGLPVCVYFQVIPHYPHANLRHYAFMADGLRDAAAEAAERGVGFVVRRSPEKLESFLEEVRAALLVGDENPCREPERWRQVLSGRLKIPFWTVDADVVVPSQVFNRSYFLLHHFRPHLRRELPRFLLPEERLEVLKRWEPEHAPASFNLQTEITQGFDKLDRTILPVESFPGGSRAARRRLAEFVRHDLARYVEQRNFPEVRGTSRLSPYLHFGQIGPLTVALAAREAVRQGWATAEACEKFLEELIGWRELAVLFVRHTPQYDSWECAAPWAKKTLMEHAADPRPYRVSFEQLERGESPDELWNAAQREMVREGWMHGYMRMYWAKKILEWAPAPETAFDWAVTLNDRYQLDGRDPNGYAGIAWAIVGKHDRPWFDRPVFGLIRTMSGASLAKKFDARKYVERQGTGNREQPTADSLQ
jgi:deoxyribodipyrimidine photo-lyase